MRWFKLFPNDEHQWRLFGIRDKAIPKDAVDADFDSFLTDAPADGSQYARQNGEWTQVQGGGGGGSTWSSLPGKPFNTIGANLKVVGGALTVDTVNAVQQDNTKPITSAAVYTEVGNIEALLASI